MGKYDRNWHGVHSRFWRRCWHLDLFAAVQGHYRNDLHAERADSAVLFHVRQRFRAQRNHGRRIVGDAAQDYIASKQFALGPDRVTSVKITAEGKIITCDAVIANVTSFGGQTLDVNAFGCTLRLNGQPTLTDVTP